MADELKQYKCPHCGGALEFNASVQKLKCPYCDSEFEMEDLKQMDEDLDAEQPDEMHWDENPSNTFINDEGMAVYVCQSCGGEIIGDVNVSAMSCPFCGNPVVISGNVAGDLKPDLVIPFKLDKNAAKNGYFNFIKGKKLLPKVFRDQNHIDEIKGVYVPYWLYTAEADANIKYTATRVRSWSDRNYNYTETQYYSVYRGGSLGFENVPVDGSTKFADNITEAVEPFYYQDAVDFQTAYLAGYLADKYNVSSEECITRANERVKRSTESAFAQTVSGYATVTPAASSVKFEHGQVKYALLPIWLLNTTWEGQRYTFAMNGQTGKFIGDLPIDKSLKTGYWFKYFGIAAAVTFALVTLIAMLLG